MDVFGFGESVGLVVEEEVGADVVGDNVGAVDGDKDTGADSRVN